MVIVVLTESPAVSRCSNWVTSSWCFNSLVSPRGALRDKQLLEHSFHTQSFESRSSKANSRNSPFLDGLPSPSSIAVYCSPEDVCLSEFLLHAARKSSTALNTYGAFIMLF